MKRIKKIAIFLFFVLLLIPFTIGNVYAVDCSDVQKTVGELDEITNQIDQLECLNTDDGEVMAECNILSARKAKTLEKIFQYNDEKICPTIDLSGLVSAYSDECSNEFSSELKEISDTVMNVFFVSAPFLILIFSSLDFFKVIAGANPSEAKKNRSNFFKRVVAFVLLYTTPLIVRGVFSLTQYNINGTSYICSETIELNLKVSSARASGKYYGYKKSKNKSKSNKKGNSTVGAGDRQAIADAAYDIRANAISNGYSYGCNGAGIDVQGTSAVSNMCCAELIAPALYHAGIYDYDTASSIHTASAYLSAERLYDRGWDVIYDFDEVEPGDVLVYEKIEKWWEASGGKIDGEYIPICHIDIYYGDGLKVSTGSFSSSSVATSFYTGETYWDDGGSSKVYCALRYAGD